MNNTNNQQLIIIALGLSIFLAGLIAYHTSDHPFALWASGMGFTLSLLSVRRK